MAHWKYALPLCSALALILTTPGMARAQNASPQPAASTPADQAQTSADVFTKEELVKLIKPVALYPDPLLAQLLPASAYPLDIVQASRWMARNKASVDRQDFSGLDKLDIDPTVKALARFPEVMQKLDADLDWTSDLGDAFVNQPEDVADVIQELRATAEKAGTLKSTKQQKVVKRQENGQQVVVIEPAEPDVIYVPTYDPAVVYQPYNGDAIAAGLIGFGTGVLVGSIINNNWNWNSGIVYPPVWPGYPGYRPPPPGGIRPPPGGIGPRPTPLPGGGNINIGNDVNIGNGSNIINNKPWSPNPDRYRPGQGTKPGLADRPSTKPGSGAIASNRPGGGGDRPGAGAPASRPSAPATGAGAGRPSKPATPARPTAKPAPAPKAAAGKSASRPKAASRPASPSAFGGVALGGSAAALGARGAASRMQMGGRPGPAMMGRPGGGGGFAHGGGRGGGGMARGGGGGGRGGRR